MKKLVIFLIAIMFVSAMPNIVNAQSNDPFEQQTLKARDNTTKREKKINRRKDAEAQEAPAKQAPVQQAPKQEPAKKPVVKEEAKPVVSEMTLSNPCDEWLDVEFVSLIGSKGSQTMKLTIKLTNHETNEELKVGSNFVAFDDEGNEHSSDTYYASTSKDLKLITDVPVKYTINIPEKANPAKVKKMPVISFNVGRNCRIEMRNVPITWK